MIKNIKKIGVVALAFVFSISPIKSMDNDQDKIKHVKTFRCGLYSTIKNNEEAINNILYKEHNLSNKNFLSNFRSALTEAKSLIDANEKGPITVFLSDREEEMNKLRLLSKNDQEICSWLEKINFSWYGRVE